MWLLSCMHEEMETQIATAAYVTLCRVVHMRVYAAFKNILRRVRMLPGQTRTQNEL
jgi:hypothetical protein